MSSASSERGRAHVFQGPIWEGVYSNFDEVPRIGEGFAGGAWNSAMQEQGRQATAHSGGTAADAVAMYSMSLLPLVVALTEPADRAVRILDFGGGVGTTFAAVTQTVQRHHIEYHIVEMPNVCDIGTRVFQGDSRVTFHSTLPISIANVDIVHFGSSIQYVSEWREFLERIALYRPRTLLFTELMAGDIPTFATAQNYYGSTIPVWFFNFGEFTDHLARLGFHLEFRAPFGGSYLGKAQPCPQPNFAPEYRLGHTSHALFSSDHSTPPVRTQV